MNELAQNFTQGMKIRSSACLVKFNQPGLIEAAINRLAFHDQDALTRFRLQQFLILIDEFLTQLLARPRRTSRLPTWFAALMTPSASICSMMRAARL